MGTAAAAKIHKHIDIALNKKKTTTPSEQPWFWMVIWINSPLGRKSQYTKCHWFDLCQECYCTGFIEALSTDYFEISMALQSVTIHTVKLQMAEHVPKFKFSMI